MMSQPTSNGRIVKQQQRQQQQQQLKSQYILVDFYFLSNFRLRELSSLVFYTYVHLVFSTYVLFWEKSGVSRGSEPMLVDT